MLQISRRSLSQRNNDLVSSFAHLLKQSQLQPTSPPPPPAQQQQPQQQAKKAKAVSSTPQPKVPDVSWTVAIPTSHPNHPALSKSAKIRDLRDYKSVVQTLNQAIQDRPAMNALPSTDPRRIFLSHLAETVAMNPSICGLAQKRRALNIALDFFEGKKLDVTVKALEGTQQGGAKFRHNQRVEP
jgi:hypothetical protein